MTAFWINRLLTRLIPTQPTRSLPALMLASLLGVSSCVTWAAPDAGSVLQQLESRPGTFLSTPQLKTPLEPTAPATDEGGPVVHVNDFRIEGRTLLSASKLKKALKGFTGRDLSLTQLQEAAWVVVQTYRQAGWLVNAMVPQQEIEQGVVTLRVVEAQLGQVHMQFPEGVKMPRKRIAVMAKILLIPGEPINLRTVDRLLLLIDDLPGVIASASFAPGTEQGSTDVHILLGSDKAVDGNVSVDNMGSVSTGASRVSASVSVNNPAGLGDALQVQAVRTDGSRYARVAFSVPVGLDGWRLGVHASDLRYNLIGSFAALQASGAAQTWGLDFSSPLIRQPEHNLNGLLSIDRKIFDNQALANTQASEPATVSKYHLDVFRSGLTGNWFDQYWSPAQNSASLQASYGRVDLTHSPNASADANAARTDGAFRKLNFNYSREQSWTGQLTGYVQTALQWANTNVDSSEKIYLGGASGVRAYPSNEAGGSSGATFTTGLKYRFDASYTVNGFADWGRIQAYRNNLSVNNTELANVNLQSLRGIGLSLNWHDTQGRELSATWSRRMGINPGANTSTGADSDGTRTLHRLWLSAALNF